MANKYHARNRTEMYSSIFDDSEILFLKTPIIALISKIENKTEKVFNDGINDFFKFC